MTLKTAVLIYDGVAELDFAAPWEVFNGSKALLDSKSDMVFTVSHSKDTVKCYGGLKVTPDYTLDNMPEADVLIVPGTILVKELVTDTALVGWLKRAAKSAKWVAGVCTGSMLVAEAGLLEGKAATTHWMCIEELKKYENITVMEKIRYVRDGNVVTSAGVSAGLDMALWLIGELRGREHAREVQHLLEYYPAPPYQAEV